MNSMAGLCSTKREQLQSKRMHVAMAAQGGRTSLASIELPSMESCRLNSDRESDGIWAPLPTTPWRPCADMRQARTALGAAALGGTVYAVGGQARGA